VEIVFVQLAHETCEIAVLEVFWEDRLCEFFVLSLSDVNMVSNRCLAGTWSYLEHDETVSFVTPSHD
jgi:hypothetical protein